MIRAMVRAMRPDQCAVAYAITCALASGILDLAQTAGGTGYKAKGRVNKAPASQA